MTWKDPLARHASTSADTTALTDGRRRWSYRELLRWTRKSSARLAGLGETGTGTGGSSRLALLLEDRVGAALLLLAGPRAGLVVAPLDPGLTRPELSEALDQLDPVAVVCDAATRDRAVAVGDRRAILLWTDEAELEPVVRSDGAGTVDGKAGEASGTRARGIRRVAGVELFRWADVHYVVWTSGTSGSPRGVLLTGRGLDVVVRGSRERLALGPGDRWLMTLSPAHMGGLATVLRSVTLGATLVVRRRFEAEELLALARDGRVTHASLVPTLLHRLLAAGRGRPAPRGLRCLLVGGARTPAERVEEAVELDYPVALTYGMTETSSQVATAPPEKVRRKPSTVGTALPGVELRVADDGEIRVRGPSLAAGYLGRPSAHREGSHGRQGGRVDPLDLDEDGWLRTGDLGRFDRDGDLLVTGRRSLRILSGGVTVDPLEVEEALISVPGVSEAAVVGVPDREWGERVVAALVREGPEKVTEEMVESLARARLAGPKRPRLYRFVEALPRTATGKVDRRTVATFFAEAGDPRRGEQLS